MAQNTRPRLWEPIPRTISRSFGSERVAMVANVVRYRLRSAVRDVGKVPAVPGTAIDRLAKLLPYYGDDPQEVFRQAGLDPGRRPYGL